MIKNKLPMFYERINYLLKLLNDCYIRRRGLSYFGCLRQLYMMVRADLPADKIVYFDEQLKNVVKTAKEQPTVLDRVSAYLSYSYPLACDLMTEMNKVGVMQQLKKQLPEEI